MEWRNKENPKPFPASQNPTYVRYRTEHPVDLVLDTPSLSNVISTFGRIGNFTFYKEMKNGNRLERRRTGNEHVDQKNKNSAVKTVQFIFSFDDPRAGAQSSRYGVFLFE